MKSLAKTRSTMITIIAYKPSDVISHGGFVDEYYDSDLQVQSFDVHEADYGDDYSKAEREKAISQSIESAKKCVAFFADENRKHFRTNAPYYDLTVLRTVTEDEGFEKKWLEGFE